MFIFKPCMQTCMHRRTCMYACALTHRQTGTQIERQDSCLKSPASEWHDVMYRRHYETSHSLGSNIKFRLTIIGIRVTRDPCWSAILLTFFIDGHSAEKTLCEKYSAWLIHNFGRLQRCVVFFLYILR